MLGGSSNFFSGEASISGRYTGAIVRLVKVDEVHPICGLKQPMINLVNGIMYAHSMVPGEPLTIY